jgi:hypothetical protein
MKGAFSGIVSTREYFDVNSDQARQRAEKSLKKEERAQDGRQAMIEYKAHALAVREKTARFEIASISWGCFPVSA